MGIFVLVPALLLILSGCAPDAGFPPDMNIPNSYGRAQPASAKPISLVWWHGFRSGELNRLVEAARTNNLDLAMAAARMDQADAQIQVAGSALFPTLDASGGARRSLAPSSGGGRGGHSNLFSGLLSTSYELDFWGKNSNNLLAARHTAIGSRYNYDVVELSTIAAVANTYLQLLAAQDELSISERNIRSASGILNVIRDRVNAGTATSLDLAQQEAVVAQQKATVPPLRISISQYRSALAVLAGEFSGQTGIRGGSLNGLSAPRPAPGLPSYLLLRRPDIRLAEVTLAASNAKVASARAALLPSFSLTGSAGYESPLLKTLFNPQSALYSAAANAIQPLFDGGRLKGQLELQEGFRSEDVQAYRKTVLSAFADVGQALTAVRETTLQVRLQSAAAGSAEKAYKIAEEQLRAGTADITTVLNTQQSYFSAQRILVFARLSQLQASVSLHQALGGGWAASEVAAAERMAQPEKTVADHGR